MSMTIPEPILPRKWALKAHNQRVVLSKGMNESARHVIMKGMLWALYLPHYPTLTIEIRIGDRYKPDLVAFDPQPNIFAADKPLFWGESGVVSQDKIASIIRRYPDTHFAWAKWDADLRPTVATLQKAVDRIKRTAPFDVVRFPADSLTQFVDEAGEVHISHNQLEWMRLE
ncbi:MAG TPA: hypothetical protein VHL11_20600 [Phototrophicaceae bacterium]|jgi:hypothetical protein|nr:hypothetical protein [Phototrophicaceae bacterium]